MNEKQVTQNLATSWDTSKDELIFGTGALVVNSMEPFIKRSVLRAIARIYDPLKL